MGFGSTAEAPAKCTLKYSRISECCDSLADSMQEGVIGSHLIVHAEGVHPELPLGRLARECEVDIVAAVQR